MLHIILTLGAPSTSKGNTRVQVIDCFHNVNCRTNNLNEIIHLQIVNSVRSLKMHYYALYVYVRRPEQISNSFLDIRKSRMICAEDCACDEVIGRDV